MPDTTHLFTYLQNYHFMEPQNDSSPSLAVPAFQVKRLYEFEGGPTGYYVKGHKNVSEFLQAVASCFPSESKDDLHDRVSEQVRHEHWRMVPVNDNRQFYSMISVKAVPGSRGSFPVTVLG